MVTLPYDDAVTATTSLAPAQSGERTRLASSMKASTFAGSNFPKALAESLSDELTMAPSATLATSAKFLAVTLPPTRIGHRADLLARGRDQFERLPIGLAGQDQAVGAAEADGEIDVLGESAARHGYAGAVMDVGEDRDIRRVAGVARPDRGEGLRRSRGRTASSWRRHRP